MDSPIPPVPIAAQNKPGKRVLITLLNLLGLVSVIPIGFLTFLLAAFSTDSGTSSGILPIVGIGAALCIAIIGGVVMSQRKSSYKWAIAAALPGLLLGAQFIFGLVTTPLMMQQMRSQSQVDFDKNIGPSAITYSKPKLVPALEAYKKAYGKYPQDLVEVLNSPVFPFNTLCPEKDVATFRSKHPGIQPWDFGICTGYTTDYLSEEQRNLLFAVRSFLEPKAAMRTYESINDGSSYKLCYGYYSKPADCFGPG